MTIKTGIAQRALWQVYCTPGSFSCWLFVCFVQLIRPVGILIKTSITRYPINSKLLPEPLRRIREMKSFRCRMGRRPISTSKGKRNKCGDICKKKQKKHRCLISSCPVISTVAPEGRVSWFYHLNRFGPGRNSPVCVPLQKDCCIGPIITVGAPISPRAEEKQSMCDGDRATLRLGGGRETLTDGAARGQRGGEGRESAGDVFTEHFVC